MLEGLYVPRDVLQRAYDALEENPDWSKAGSDIWILYHQLGSILYPDPAYVTKPQTLVP